MTASPKTREELVEALATQLKEVHKLAAQLRESYLVDGKTLVPYRIQDVWRNVNGSALAIERLKHARNQPNQID